METIQILRQKTEVETSWNLNTGGGSSTLAICIPSSKKLKVSECHFPCKIFPQKVH